MIELYRKHRPCKFSDVLGQDSAIKALVEMGKSGKIPHAILFTGPSGTGKTTLARILRDKLKCSDMDFVEKNAADSRGIDMVRDIRGQMSSLPAAGDVRVYLLDEVHQLTSDAQSALLKILEDTPNHVYFFLATTDPDKLKNTIITRCTHIKCKSLGRDDMLALIKSVSDREDKQLNEVVADKIVDAADGSARKALVILHQVLDLPDADTQILAIESEDAKRDAIEIARALLKPKTEWHEMAAILSNPQISKNSREAPEKIRWQIMGYAKAVLLKSGNPRAARIIEEFRDNWFDSKENGLVVSCYNVVTYE